MGAHTRSRHDHRQDTSRYWFSTADPGRGLPIVRRPRRLLTGRLPTASFRFHVDGLEMEEVMSEAIDRDLEASTARSVCMTLKLVFGIVPIVAGLDKFTNLLVDWQKYIAPAFANMLPFSGRTFMYIVGVIEIVAGL